MYCTINTMIIIVTNEFLMPFSSRSEARGLTLNLLHQFSLTECVQDVYVVSVGCDEGLLYLLTASLCCYCTRLEPTLPLCRSGFLPSQHQEREAHPGNCRCSSADAQAFVSGKKVQMEHPQQYPETEVYVLQNMP